MRKNMVLINNILGVNFEVETAQPETASGLQWKGLKEVYVCPVHAF